MTGPAAGIVAWLMFGIYQIGYSIEDPFQGSLRLSILCDAIRSDVMGGADDDLEEEARSSAYTIEQNSWVDDASHTVPLMPQEILISSVLTPTTSPVFSMAEYKALEQ